MTDNKEPVEQTKAALEEAVATIKTPEQADQVIADLEETAGNVKAQEVARRVPTPSNAQEAAQSISQAAEAPTPIKPQVVITQAAAQIAATKGEDKELLQQGVQQAINPTPYGVKTPETEQERQLLQEALLRRLKPLQAADAALFLAVNRMPHPEWLNSAMYALATLMNRGDGWALGLLAALLGDRKRAGRALVDVLPVLWLTTATVEFPVKHFFRRRRPFISIVQAIVIGKKPGHYSFPSGHSAAAFAGAWLICQHYPRLRPLLYGIAALVGFSRVYLGAHYPGDVLSGATSGVVLAAGYQYLIQQFREELEDALD